WAPMLVHDAAGAGVIAAVSLRGQVAGIVGAEPAAVLARRLARLVPGGTLRLGEPLAAFGGLFDGLADRLGGVAMERRELLVTGGGEALRLAERYRAHPLQLLEGDGAGRQPAQHLADLRVPGVD